MHSESRQTRQTGLVGILLRAVRAVFVFFARIIGRVTGGMLVAVLCMALVHTAFPGMIREALGFNRAQEISDVVLREELAAISELASYEFTYANHVDFVNQPQLLGCDVAWTDHQFSFDYQGTIKAGFDLEKISLLWIDFTEHSVGIFLPEAVVLSNEISIDLDTYADRNNLCNPLQPFEVLEYLYSRKAPELERALELGLLEEARENAMRLIRRLFEAHGYSVDFI